MTSDPKSRLLPPMQPVEKSKAKHRFNTSKRRTAGRFQVLNQFVDEGARRISTTAIACWVVVFRETKPAGTATLTHDQIAACVGKTRKTVSRTMKELEKAGFLTVVRQGGWRRGPSTYLAIPMPGEAPASPVSEH